MGMDLAIGKNQTKNGLQSGTMSNHLKELATWTECRAKDGLYNLSLGLQRTSNLSVN